MTASVLLLTDTRIDAHASPGHPERQARREAAAAGVRDAAGSRLAEEPAEPATDAELTRVHDQPNGSGPESSGEHGSDQANHVPPSTST